MSVGTFSIIVTLRTSRSFVSSCSTGRDVSLYPDNLTWGVSCGPTGSRAQYQNLILHGFSDDKCRVGHPHTSVTPMTCT